jgi:hypothetical protein
VAARLDNVIPFGFESSWSDDLRQEPAFSGAIEQEMDIQVRAFHCSRAAQRDERDGLPYSAAMKWRAAAELFAPNTQAVESCWREWERIMHLPRRLAGPASGSPHRLICH